MIVSNSWNLFSMFSNWSSIYLSMSPYEAWFVVKVLSKSRNLLLSFVTIALFLSSLIVTSLISSSKLSVDTRSLYISISSSIIFCLAFFISLASINPSISRSISVITWKRFSFITRYLSFHSSYLLSNFSFLTITSILASSAAIGVDTIKFLWRSNSWTCFCKLITLFFFNRIIRKITKSIKTTPAEIK